MDIDNQLESAVMERMMAEVLKRRVDKQKRVLKQTKTILMKVVLDKLDDKLGDC